jgi:GntR family transcriptional repressor for pyruvate dehydrogenase complex
LSPPLASDAVHARIRGDILEGRLAPGDSVPSERSLSEELGVNRHAVREALKRLQQAGLVRISQGGATRVLDWRDGGGLEVLLDLMNAPGTPPAGLMRSVLEMREVVGVDAAGRFCERADAGARRRAAALAESAESGVATGSADGLEAFVELWRAIVDGSGNLAYRLALNSLNRALEAYPEVAGSLLSPTDSEGLRRLGAALDAGEAEEAEEAARGLLSADVRAFG